MRAERGRQGRSVGAGSAGTRRRVAALLVFGIAAGLYLLAMLLVGLLPGTRSRRTDPAPMGRAAVAPIRA